MRQRQRQRLTAEQRQALRAQQRQHAEAERVELDRNGDETSPPEEALEPQELEDYGDSDATLEGDTVQSPFDRGWLGRLPLVHQLPRRAAPRVCYWIDESYKVKRLEPAELAGSRLRLAIACAVAAHFSKHRVEITRPFGWCDAPAIAENEGLLALVAGEHKNQLE